ncbi:MAG: sialate O-acetylesterase [Steroidobacteraceae bacterium]
MLLSKSLVRAGAVLASLAFQPCAHADDSPLLHELFGDHVVLQREQPIVVWGTTQPAAQLTLTLAGSTASAVADAAGKWTATLPAMKAGGPHVLVAESGGRQQKIDDVLIGDVWLCSGQSNMGLQVKYALDAHSQIAGSTNDSIRMLTVPLSIATTPLERFGKAAAWLKAEPRNTPDFSAACYYFARELQKTTHVPMGLVNSSWGGSRLEAWMSEGSLRGIENYGVPLDLLALYAKDPAAAKRAWGQQWEKWWRGKVSQSPQPWELKQDSEWRPAPRGLGAWERWGVSELANYNGMLWYRTRVTLTAAQARQPATLSLGRIDEVDEVWVNGRFADTNSGADVSRVYKLDAKLLHAGENVIVVNALDTYGDGGMVGSPSERKLTFGDGATVALDQDWQFHRVPADIGSPPRAPWESTAGVTTIHNAMIAPLGRFGFKGAVWYQGESNTGDAGNYQALLAGLMSDWRGKFGADLPFLIVQLANYGMPPTKPVESGWASLREAQRLAVKQDAHAALAVTIDIGDRYDIHPANKQELGRRLSRAARNLIEHEAIAVSGPVVASARAVQGTVEVAFDDVEGELVAYSSQRPIGFELCGAAPGSCRFVDAVIEGKRVVLSAAGQTPATRVRYCWADSPVCTLYDKSTLPAGPFEVTIDAER